MKNGIKNLIASALLILLSSANLNAEKLKISGSTACQNVFLLPGSEELKKESGIELEVQGVGTGKGLIELIEGKVSVSSASQNLESTVANAKRLKPELKIPQNLTYHELTKDEVVVIVHKDNKIKTLSKEQIKDIFTGKIKNWKEVGGENTEIKVAVSKEGSGTEGTFHDAVLGDAEYAANTYKTQNIRTVTRTVINDPMAIGISDINLVKESANTLKIVNSEKIERSLGLITIGEPNENVKKVIEFFKSGSGKKYLKYGSSR